MQKNLMYVAVGVLVCLGFSFIFGEFVPWGRTAFQEKGTLVFIAGVLVAILFKDNK